LAEIQYREIITEKFMKSRLPTKAEIDELLAFLPQLYAQGFRPVKRWMGGDRDTNGSIVMPYPEYDEVVDKFFKVASKECWLDFEYNPEEAYRMLKDEEAIKAADLAKIKTMLTFCVRGERFSDGHWEAMIEGGYVRRLLVRLGQIRLQII
jgi:hypothetical protein